MGVSFARLVVTALVAAPLLIGAEPAAARNHAPVQPSPMALDASSEASTVATVWSRRYSRPGDDTAWTLAVSADGSQIFVAGGSEGSTTMTDYATVAYDAAGGTSWSKRYTRPRNDIAYALEVSPDGSTVFVTGASDGSLGDGDYATVAYDGHSGATLWSRRYARAGNDVGRALGVSPDGSRVFVTGYSAGTTTAYDYATVAYDAFTGAKLWVTRYNGPANSGDFASALSVSPDGSEVFVTGDSYTSNGSADYATVAYDAATGAARWVTRYNGPGNSADYPNAVAASPDGSAVFVSGQSVGSTTGWDYATVAYDVSGGSELWVKRYTRPEDVTDVATDLEVSPDGADVFVTGYSDGTGIGYDYDYATVVYGATTGAKQWVTRYNGPANKADFAYALGLSPDGSKVFVTGSSEGSSSGSDYATVSYDAFTGSELWTKRYGPGSIATGIGVSPNGSQVFITGASDWITDDADYATVAYAANP